VNIDFDTEPIGIGKDGTKIFFKDIWPSSEEIANVSGCGFKYDFVIKPYIKLEPSQFRPGTSPTSDISFEPLKYCCLNLVNIQLSS